MCSLSHFFKVQFSSELPISCGHESAYKHSRLPHTYAQLYDGAHRQMVAVRTVPHQIWRPVLPMDIANQIISNSIEASSATFKELLYHFKTVHSQSSLERGIDC